MKNLVVVESPAKAKTINKYLGKDCKVLASFGHIRDLPSKNGSVDTEHDFKMKYQLNRKAGKAVKLLVDTAKGIDKLVLATDPDREGEAIAWHVVEVLKYKKAIDKNVKIERVVFNAITKNKVNEAIKNPRKIDMHLVNAQQARRALDYLVGFTLSPVLWRKLPGSKSAGRVQSVALRLICRREKDIEKFVPQEYWDVLVDLKTKEKKKLTARLTHVDGKKLDKFDIKTKKDADKIVKNLTSKNYEVTDIKRKKVQRRPYAPFTTSTLQQEASRKLHFSTKKTMMVAQKLYEGVNLGHGVQGLITYMRTDGVYTAPEAIQSARELIKSKYGDKYLPEKPINYQSKVKNAQEAHEAIRPTDPKLTPQDAKKYLTEDQYKLYSLIWKRLIASQMANVVMNQVSIIIKTISEYGTLRASGSTIEFDGFYVLYNEGKDEESEEKEGILPKVDVGEALKFVKVIPGQHFTEPPARFSEATLVKKMEELGIGRPSTYANIISVLQVRDYVKLHKKRFYPEERGRVVNAFLKKFFLKYVEYDYTAKLEDDLDEISNGRYNWKEFLKEFWKPFHKQTESVLKISPVEILESLNKDLGEHIFGVDKKGNLQNTCPKCKVGKLKLKVGKFGAFLACSNYPECKHTQNIHSLAESKISGEEKSAQDIKKEDKFDSKKLGKDKAQEFNVYLKKGPYGFYVQLGEDGKKPKPKRVGLPKGLSFKEVDLKKALQLLSLPRTVGQHPSDGNDVIANIGPYGPYLKWNDKFYSVRKDNILTVGLKKAVEVIEEYKNRKSQKKKKKK